MLFNSFDFIIFFVIVTSLYFILPHRFRWALMLVASCFFYMTFIPAYLLILFLLIIIDYSCAILMEPKKGRVRKAYLIFSIISTVCVLFLFKYFNFFNENLAGIAGIMGWNYSIEALSIILPIGLSFHTFQSLSYVIEVYRGKQSPERHFGIYSLYVMFYPQLVAGPIERPQNLLHQFYEHHAFDYGRVADGLRLMFWGLFKKVVIADRLAAIVGQVYSAPGLYNGPSLILATVAFSFQVYCDFSGYSDIAIGSARVMGFKLMENFRKPFSAVSISEFWKRWHISLTTWFKDYIYYPMISSKITKARIYWATLAIFLISGLWHGASWTFVLWGLLHGLYLVASYISKEWRQSAVSFFRLDRAPRLHWFIRVMFTFTLVNFSFILFRAESLGDAWMIISRLFVDISSPVSGIISEIGIPYLLSMAVFISFMLLFDHPEGSGLAGRIYIKSWLMPVAVSTIAFIAFLVFGAFFQAENFIYFQF